MKERDLKVTEVTGEWALINNDLLGDLTCLEVVEFKGLYILVSILWVPLNSLNNWNTSSGGSDDFHLKIHDVVSI